MPHLSVRNAFALFHYLSHLSVSYFITHLISPSGTFLINSNTCLICLSFVTLHTYLSVRNIFELSQYIQQLYAGMLLNYLNTFLICLPGISLQYLCLSGTLLNYLNVCFICLSVGNHFGLCTNMSDLYVCKERFWLISTPALFVCQERLWIIPTPAWFVCQERFILI